MRFVEGLGAKRTRFVLWALAACVGVPAPQIFAAEPRELGRIKVKQLDEASGITASRQNAFVYWLHNDGDSGKVFAVRATGKLAAAIDCPIAVADLEDIAIGPGPVAGADYLYLGDVGDNKSNRREVQVVRFPEPILSSNSAPDVDVKSCERIRLEFPDGPHDCETLLVDPVMGDLFVVTKEPSRTRVYTAAAAELGDGVTIKLRLAGTLGVADVSAGAISPDGRWILLRQEAHGWLWPRGAGETIAEAMARPFRSVPVRGDRQGPNGEGITFSADGSSYVTVSEGKKPAICEFPLPAATAE